jgi:Family of unknown function (DUF5996)
VSPICTHLDRIELTELPEAIPGCEDHWWDVPLYVDTRGLTTRRMRHRGTTFEITFDFVDHDLVVATADGRAEAFELRDGLAVADFDARLHRMLADLGIDDWSDSVLEESPAGSAARRARCISSGTASTSPWPATGAAQRLPSTPTMSRRRPTRAR